MIETHIVRELRLGNSRVRIADNYCVRTDAETGTILKRAAGQAKRYSTERGEKEHEKQKSNDGNLDRSRSSS